jgi:hydroxymethylpyrimidine kinase/phosphomethylpyrimidine kinase
MAEAGRSKLPVAMTIAGLDPSGGAGILADTRTFAAFNCYPVAVVTAITFQNSNGVSGFVPEKPETVAGQLLPLFAELQVSAVKTGMLPSREIVCEVSRVLGEHNDIPLVIDPVMTSTSGYQLMDQSALSDFKDRLMPLARIITPNIPEAETLVGFSITDLDDQLRAAEQIREMGVRGVLIKGGHLDERLPLTDVLNDEGKVEVFRGKRFPSAGFRGTGCTLASAIAAQLAYGNSLEMAVKRAREFLIERMSASLRLGDKDVLC